MNTRCSARTLKPLSPELLLGVRRSDYGRDCDKFEPRFSTLPELTVILDGDGMPIRVPSLFLAECALLSNGGTGDTSRTYGECLAAWLRYVSRLGLTIQAADEETFGRYRAELVHGGQEGSPDQNYASATVKLRVSVAALFHEWGERRGLFESPLGKYLLDRHALRRAAGSHDYIPGLRAPLAPFVVRRLPVALTTDDLARLFAVVRMPYALMFRWGLVVGLRRFEVQGLRVSQLPSEALLQSSRDGLVRMQLRRKGGRTHTVYAPASWLKRPWPLRCGNAQLLARDARILSL